MGPLRASINIVCSKKFINLRMGCVLVGGMVREADLSAETYIKKKKSNNID